MSEVTITIREEFLDDGSSDIEILWDSDRPEDDESEESFPEALAMKAIDYLLELMQVEDMEGRPDDQGLH